MLDILEIIGSVTFFAALLLLAITFVRHTGNEKQYGIIAWWAFALLTLATSLAEDGAPGIFTFLEVMSFITVLVLIAMLIHSAVNKTGKLKRYGLGLLIAFAVMFIGFFGATTFLEEGPEDAVETNAGEENQANDQADKNETNAKQAEDDQANEVDDQTSTDNNQQAEQAPVVSPDGQLTVHYIDVGQADATLLEVIEAGETTTIVIDAGDWNKTDAVDYLTAAGVTTIDALVGTHPHADHIGQMDKILETFDVTEVWMSGHTASSQVYQRTMKAIDAAGANYVEPRTGDAFQLGPLDVTIVHPETLARSNANDSSVSLHVVYGELAFLFTGDAERPAEEAMLASEAPLRADILRLGHHGSDTSTIPAFLEAVQPEVAIYSAGNNSYGHPSASVIDRLKDADIDVYGTDVHGTIILKTDGATYTITTGTAGTVSGKTADCIDINTARAADLTAIIHISEARAEALIAARPFASLDELTRIKGIGPERLADILTEGKACVR